jgi:hypothetical protein
MYVTDICINLEGEKVEIAEVWMTKKGRFELRDRGARMCQGEFTITAYYWDGVLKAVIKEGAFKDEIIYEYPEVLKKKDLTENELKCATQLLRQMYATAFNDAIKLIKEIERKAKEIKEELGC